MVQRFIDEITSSGEWSLIFFDRKFSHGVLKHPKPGDFRVQEQFGGTLEISAIPQREMVAQAESVLDLVEGSLLYARVDGAQIGERLLLMELELIEPALFLAASRSSALCFAEAIARFASRNTNSDGALHGYGSCVKRS